MSAADPGRQGPRGDDQGRAEAPGGGAGRSGDRPRASARCWSATTPAATPTWPASTATAPRSASPRSRSSCPPRPARPSSRPRSTELNADPACTGYIVQLPLPGSLDDNWALGLVDPAKDADGLHPVNLGRLVLGEPGPLPCTPRGIVELLRRNGIPLAGAEVCVIGRGTTVGRPLGLLLTRKSENATVTLCHTGTVDVAAHTRDGRHRGRRGRPPRTGHRRHDQAGRGLRRRRHHPDRGRAGR